MRFKAAFVLLTLVSMALVACGSHAAKGPSLSITNQGGKKVSLSIEIADTPAALEQGLSGRESLGANAGMLFVIVQHGPGFWMKDTTIPLSVAFIGDCGQIVALADMQPLSLEIHGTDQPYGFGLEVNQGWFAQHDIGVGSQVALPAAQQMPDCGRAGPT